jgi:hypothetical protein
MATFTRSNELQGAVVDADLRGARSTLERTWAATLERVAAMPAGTVNVSVGGEWSWVLVRGLGQPIGRARPPAGCTKPR